MDLSLIQKDILITLISLYHQHSQPVKGEEIAEVIRRNPGTVRNQMQALKAIGLVDGTPGPKGGYNPTAQAYKALNLDISEKEYDVKISRNGEVVPGVKVVEIAFTTLCHPDICRANATIRGSVKVFEIGDQVTIGPTPVNKLLIRGEVLWEGRGLPDTSRIHLRDDIAAQETYPVLYEQPTDIAGEIEYDRRCPPCFQFTSYPGSSRDRG